MKATLTSERREMLRALVQEVVRDHQALHDTQFQEWWRKLEVRWNHRWRRQLEALGPALPPDLEQELGEIVGDLDTRFRDYVAPYFKLSGFPRHSHAAMQEGLAALLNLGTRMESRHDWPVLATGNAVAVVQPPAVVANVVVTDRSFRAFLVAALHEDRKLHMGEELRVDAIARRAKLPNAVALVCARRALHERLAYHHAGDDESTLYLEHDDVQHEIDRLEPGDAEVVQHEVVSAGPRTSPASPPFKYQLVERLRAGAFADVWTARDPFDRLVAAKIVRPSMAVVSSVFDHARALARAEHPNVVRVYTTAVVTEPGSEAELEALIMELLVGDTLEDRLRARALTVAEVTTFGANLIDGLAHIHDQQLAHGDLHEGNVMLTASGLKIIDILYQDTLQLLSAASRENRLRADLRAVRGMLLSMVERSELPIEAQSKFEQSCGRLVEDCSMLRAGLAAAVAVMSPPPATLRAPRRRQIELHGSTISTCDEQTEACVASDTPGAVIQVEVEGRRHAVNVCTPCLEALVHEGTWKR